MTYEIIDTIQQLFTNYTKEQDNAVKIKCAPNDEEFKSDESSSESDESSNTDKKMENEELREGLLLSTIEDYIKRDDIDIKQIQIYLEELQKIPENMADTTTLQTKLKSIIESSVN